MMIPAIPIVLMSLPASASSNDDVLTAFAVLIIVLQLAWIVGLFAYVIIGWGRGQTYGMRIMNIRLIDASTGGPIGAGRAFLRYMVMYLMGVPCYLGYLSILLDKSGYYRGWQDHAANSVVVTSAPR